MKGVLIRRHAGTHALFETELPEFLTKHKIHGNMVISGLIVLEALDTDGVTPVIFICPKSTEVVETTKELLKAIKEIFP